MLTQEFKHNFALWFRENSKTKNNLKDYITERICKYAKDNRPADQIVGMVTLLDDLLKLDERYLQK